MDIKDAKTTIQSSFDTAWAGETDIAWDNVEYKSENTEFVRMSIQFDIGEQASLGGITNRLFRYSGIVFLQIFTEPNENPQRNDELAQLALNFFVTPLSGIKFFNPAVKYIGISKNYFQQNVTVEIQIDQQK